MIFFISLAIPIAGFKFSESENLFAIEELTGDKKVELGRLLFFDESLSSPEGQSCATCHAPEIAFANPETGLPVSRGAITGRYGNRNDMTIAYAAFIPPLYYDSDEEVWTGGLFWDGRANTLKEQAMGPPLNPLEMANSDTMAIAIKIRLLSYANLFTEIYDSEALEDPSTLFRYMADAIEAYERSPEFSPFNSKYDRWLIGEAELTIEEKNGLQIFEAEDKGNCAACHPNTIADDGSLPLFTDFTFDNLGTPPNPENPFYSLPPELNPDGYRYIDYGLGQVLNDPDQDGKFRVPTLRNVAITPPYMHNGLFKTLFSVVSFYNSRDVANWPAPEVPRNVNMDELGDLGLTNQEMEDLVSFLQTLTDDWDSNETVTDTTIR